MALWKSQSRYQSVSEESEEAIRALGDALEKNSSLLMLDIGHNNFDAKAMQYFSEKLSLNYTILELRVGGSQGSIDAKEI